MTGVAVFHPEAADELADAAAWYEHQQPGLGDEFEDAVYGAVERPLGLCLETGGSDRISGQRGDFLGSEIGLA